MMKMTMSLAVALSLVACGDDGGSSVGGVSDSTKLSSLSREDAISVCLALVDLNPERTLTCSGVSITIGLTDEDCSTDEAPEFTAECTATVGDAKQCNRDQAALTEAQVCGGQGLPASCQAFVACVEES